MAAKRIFFLSGDRLIVYHWNSGRFSDPRAFRADEHGLTQFFLYLQQSPLDTVYLLLDVVEEEFREETIPHVLGSDRRALIRNKQTRLFRDPTYCHATFHGREAEGRRDDKMLFTALIRPDLLTPWLGQMARLKIPLTGIYSLPILSELLLKKLKISSEHVLLVTQHSTGGLRQTFFQGQRLKVSRLAMMPDIDAGRYAAYILGEVEKIRRYLGSLRLLTRDSPLDVYVVSHGPVLEDLKRQATDTVTSRHNFLDVSEVASKVRVKHVVESPHADLIFAHMLAAESPPNHYAPERERRYFSMQKARAAMIAASVLLLGSAAGWSVYKGVQAIITKQQTVVLERQTGFYDERLRLARERMPSLPAGARDIQAVVQVADTLGRYKASPMPMLQLLSGGLERFPTLYIDRIEWMASNDPGAAVGGSENQPGRDRRRGSKASSSTGDGTLYHLAHIKGRIMPFGGDYRGALETVNRFSDALAEAQSVETVSAVSLPLNTSSSERLLGNAGGESRALTAAFELRVVLKAHDGSAS